MCGERGETRTTLVVRRDCVVDVLLSYFDVAYKCLPAEMLLQGKLGCFAIFNRWSGFLSFPF